MNSTNLEAMITNASTEFLTYSFRADVEEYKAAANMKRIAELGIETARTAEVEGWPMDLLAAYQNAANLGCQKFLESWAEFKRVWVGDTEGNVDVVGV